MCIIGIQMESEHGKEKREMRNIDINKKHYSCIIYTCRKISRNYRNGIEQFHCDFLILVRWQVIVEKFEVLVYNLA
jgi:hypothetical protein